MSFQSLPHIRSAGPQPGTRLAHQGRKQGPGRARTACALGTHETAVLKSGRDANGLPDLAHEAVCENASSCALFIAF